MAGAGAFHVPALRVTTVTAPTDICLQPGPVALVVRIVKAVETDDASRVFLTVLALPGDITSFEWLGTHAKRQVIIPNTLDLLVWVLTVKEQLLCTLKVALNCSRRLSIQLFRCIFLGQTSS